VAEHQSLSQRIGLTPGKGAVIGILAAALMAVLYMQFGNSADDSSLAVVDGTTDAAVSAAPAALPPSAVATALIPVATAVKTRAATAVTASFDESKWKSPELARVVAYDPFAVPSAFPQPVRTALELQTLAEAEDSDAEQAAARMAAAVEGLQSELKSLQERGVHVIMRGQKDQYVAMIGDRTIHVGDEINGFIVTAIEPDGVRVERKLSP
jgi:hypothetical protein